MFTYHKEYNRLMKKILSSLAPIFLGNNIIRQLNQNPATEETAEEEEKTEAEVDAVTTE